MNLPNRITLARIIMIPLMIFFYLASFVPYGKIIAFVIFVVSSLTDFFDGYLARKYNLITNLGKFLDPIADKLLTTSALVLVVCDLTVPAPYGVIALIVILAREFIVSAFRQIAATKNYVMAADWWGKIKTNLQIYSCGGLMILSFLYSDTAYNGIGITVFEIINWVLLGLAVVSTIFSGVNYLVKNKKVLKDNEK